MPRIKRENGGIGVRLTVSLLDDPAVHIFLARLPPGRRRAEVIRILRDYLVATGDPAISPDTQFDVLSAWLRSRAPQSMNAKASNTSGSTPESIVRSYKHAYTAFDSQPPPVQAALLNTNESSASPATDSSGSRTPDAPTTTSAFLERWLPDD